MSRTNATPSTRQRTTPVSYPHTDLTAPYRMLAANVKSVPTNDGDDAVVAADLVHPQLGTVGHIYDSGSGSGTKFVPGDTGFGINELQEFAERCTERGHQVGGGFTPIESLLNLLLIEYGFDTHVTAMVKAGRQSLVRLVDDTEPSIRDYREVVSWPNVLFDRRDRMRAAQALTSRYPNLEQSQSWEVWTGVTWLPLPHELPPVDPAHTARLAELRQARTRWQASGDQRPFMHDYGPLADGQYVSDRSGKPDSYLLLDSPGVVETWRWCRCTTGPRSRRVRIEHWNSTAGLAGSGWAHASCRRLMAMD